MRARDYAREFPPQVALAVEDGVHNGGVIGAKIDKAVP